ncbi:hypothetical protein Goshw_013891 [Gossypium schwendimanii]|uniref:Uncharacterized protein n=1 Tax=Gossypium schwendimanii TaxID=34291 RepID=A0A7J9KL48_GOSSC|nr:hypothetical protein [Gossypium schwendimanii]
MVGQCRVPFGDLPKAVTAMHVVVQPSKRRRMRCRGITCIRVPYYKIEIGAGSRVMLLKGPQGSREALNSSRTVPSLIVTWYVRWRSRVTVPS